MTTQLPPQAGPQHSHASRLAGWVPVQRTSSPYEMAQYMPQYTRAAGPAGPPPGPGRNGLATGGFVVALIGFVLSLLPVVGIVSWLLSPLGLVLSAVGLGLARRRRAGRGLAVAGVVLGVLGLLACVAWSAAFASAVDTAATPASATPAAPSLVRYEVTGAGRAIVTYTDAQGNMGQQTSTRLPWSKDIRSEGSFPFYSVTVTNSGGVGPVGCRILLNGAVVSQQNAAGPAASASCSG